MDSDRRLELIALLAQDKTWDAVVLIGQELLDFYYPSDVFIGETDSSPGVKYIVALRNALAAIDEARK